MKQKLGSLKKINKPNKPLAKLSKRRGRLTLIKSELKKALL
jgi:hypothetical protein